MKKSKSSFVPQVVDVSEVVVKCDGGPGPLGHPAVFLNLEGGEVICPYCSCRYVLRQEQDHRSCAL